MKNHKKHYSDFHILDQEVYTFISLIIMFEFTYFPLPNNRGGRNNRGGLAKPLKKIKRGGHNKRGGLENRQTF